MSGTNLFAAQTSTLDICLTDENGLAVYAKCTGAPPTTADIFQHGCLINRTDSGTGNPALYQNVGSSAVPSWTLVGSGGGGSATSLVDTNSNTAVSVGTTAAAVNYLTVTNSATGAVGANAVQVTANGTDAAVSLSIAPKGATGILTIGLPTGTGNIVLGSSSGAQSVLIGNGDGASTVSLASNATAAVNTVNIATSATSTTAGNVVNIANTVPVGTGTNLICIGSSLAGSKLTLKGVTTSYQTANYIAVETGANNAIAGALLDYNAVAVPLSIGLRVVVKLGHTLQAGANTFDFNGGGAVAIKSHFNVANDIATAYAATGVIELFYDGTQWLDMSQ